MGLPSGDSEIWLESASEAIMLLSRRGLLLILGELASRPLRHNELARGTGMDSKQLNRVLRHALNAGLVDRNVSSSQMPVCVYYRLTPRGEDLISALVPLAAWHEEYKSPLSGVPGGR